jgi:orotate phosphoribosyltransferase
VAAPSAEDEARAIFLRRGALREGHFLLSSGLHSPVYLQCQAVLAWPADAERLAAALVAPFRTAGITAAVGPAVGGIVPAYEAARQLGVRALFVEREGGTFRLRRGQALEPSDRVLAVENVVTTGGSLREAFEPIRAAGATIAGVAALVDRSAAGSELFPGIRFVRLLRVDAPAWPASECPLCRDGVPIEAPGSRHLREEA